MSQWYQCQEENINKQIKTHETDATAHEAYYSRWTLTFHKVVWQQIWKEVVVLSQAFSTGPFWI